MTNKKIMLISTTDNMIWQFLIPHINHLTELGNKVECVCTKTGFWFDELKDKYGFIMHEINFARNPIKPSNIKGYKKLVALQKKENFDLIYCQQPVGGLMGRLIAKKFKIPCIYTAHGFHFFKGCSLKNKLIYKPVEKLLSKYTNALITINEEDYNAALKMHAQNVYKINGIGMDFKKYENINQSTDDTRKALNLTENDFVIVTVAEFIKRKNYPTMLKTISELSKTNKNVRFLICGRGKGEKQIKKQIKLLRLENNVNLLGYRKDINRILTCADLFFLASFQEGLTLSVIEAMSLGLPCVVSNVRGNRDLIVNGKGGFVVHPKDYKLFAERIKTLIDSPTLLQQFGAFNKEQSKNYTIEKVKQQLEEIYKGV